MTEPTIRNSFSVSDAISARDHTIPVVMKPVDEVRVVKTTNPTWFKLVSLLFKRGNNEIKWDIIGGPDDVFVIIFNRTRNTLVCTKQFRPGLYYNSIPHCDRLTDRPIDIGKYPLSIGFGIEFCTGVIDQNKSLEEIAIHSIREECGYEIEESNLKKIVIIKGSSEQNFFYTDVTDKMKVPYAKEDVEVLEYTISEIKDIISQPVFLNGSSSFIFGLMWFLINKNKFKY